MKISAALRRRVRSSDRCSRNVMRASSTALRSRSSVTPGQPFFVAGGGGGGGATPGSGGGGGVPFRAGIRSSSERVWVMLARLLSRLEIGGVTRGGPPSRPGCSGAGVGERGKVPIGGPFGGIGAGVGERGAAAGGGGGGGAIDGGGQGAADSSTGAADAIGSGGGVAVASSSAAAAMAACAACD